MPYGVENNMYRGFEKIVEERIKIAQRRGDFKNLRGSGEPLTLEDDRHIPEDLRMAYKILKNADFAPPEIELKKEILQTEDLLGHMTDTAEKYRTIKKLNCMILRLNSMRKGSAEFDLPQYYASKLVDRIESKKQG
jgi:hypothetical protein